jgi:hypothetical protein
MNYLNTSPGTTSAEVALPGVTLVPAVNNETYGSQTFSEPTISEFIAQVNSEVPSTSEISYGGQSNQSSSDVLVNLSGKGTITLETSGEGTFESPSFTPVDEFLLAELSLTPGDPTPPEEPGGGGVTNPDTGATTGTSSLTRRISTLNLMFKFNHRFRGARESFKFLGLIQKFIGLAAVILDVNKRVKSVLDGVYTSIPYDDEDISNIQHCIVQSAFYEQLRFAETNNRWLN